MNPSLPLRACTSGLLSVLALAAVAAAQAPIVTDLAETQRLGTPTVTGSGSSWSIRAAVENDNNNGSLPTSYRRWWHFQVGGLNAATPTTLSIRLDNVGYSDVILPVWSLSTDSGATFGPWARCPSSAVPSISSSSHTFALTVPAGITTVRIAKWFPYPVSRRDALLASIATHRHVRSIRTLGLTPQGRSIRLVELTNSNVPDTAKHRVWVHASIHPSEYPAAYMAEGLIQFLLSGSPVSELLLENLIVDVVPLANPDGTTLGNYRTNASSVNCEDEWVSPYDSPVSEVVALRTEIEQLMGTAANPGSRPIEVLLNLHASHNVAFPFHFEHVANASFDLVSNRTGVIPEVNQLEQQWIAAMMTESPYVSLGSTQSSTMSAPTRPFVESMMHDRWSIDSSWVNGGQSRVMAITLEGTYGKGPDGVQWGTDADYVLMGQQIARALGRYFGTLPGGEVTSYGAGCNGALLVGQFETAPDRLALTTFGLVPNSTAVTVLGGVPISFQLPTPAPCFALADPLVLIAGTASILGIHQLSLPIPPAIRVLDLRTQTLGLAPTDPLTPWRATNGLRARFAR